MDGFFICDLPPSLSFCNLPRTERDDRECRCGSKPHRASSFHFVSMNSQSIWCIQYVDATAFEDCWWRMTMNKGNRSNCGDFDTASTRRTSNEAQPDVDYHVLSILFMTFHLTDDILCDGPGMGLKPHCVAVLVASPFATHSIHLAKSWQDRSWQFLAPGELWRSPPPTSA
jgi:hypothetical protein